MPSSPTRRLRYVTPLAVILSRPLSFSLVRCMHSTSHLSLSPMRILTAILTHTHTFTHAPSPSPLGQVSIKILFANRSEEDILCRELLDALEKDARVEVWYTLDVKPTSEWKYSIGFISEEMIREHLPAPADKTVSRSPPYMLRAGAMHRHVGARCASHTHTYAACVHGLQVIFMCGPPPMIKFACMPNLAKVGHQEVNCHCF